MKKYWHGILLCSFISIRAQTISFDQIYPRNSLNHAYEASVKLSQEIDEILQDWSLLSSLDKEIAFQVCIGYIMQVMYHLVQLKNDTQEFAQQSYAHLLSVLGDIQKRLEVLASQLTGLQAKLFTFITDQLSDTIESLSHPNQFQP